MQFRSDFDESEFDKVTDEDIERLLACDDEDKLHRLEQRERGLYYLLHKKRDMFLGSLARISNDNGWDLGTADMEQIWDATFDSISTSVVKGNFTARGALNGYIRLIMYRRAVEFRERQVRSDPDVDPDNVSHRDKSRNESPKAEISRQIMCEITQSGDVETRDEAATHCRTRKLVGNEYLVMVHLVRLSLDGNEKLKPMQVQKSVNKQMKAEGKPELTVTAVRMALLRAFKKLGREGDPNDE